MKFSSILASLPLCITPALSQMVSIASPPAGSTLAPGSSMTVELDSAVGLTGFEHISVAIGIGDLPSSPSSSSLGTIFYAGNYTPVSHEMEKPPYQNFTVTIPSTLTGDNLLSVAHFYLVGAGLEPILEMKNISLTIAN